MVTVMVVEPTGAAAGTVTRKVASPVWPGFRTPKYAVSLLPVVRFSAVGSAMAMLPEAVEILKRDTRHFAKRQITWFKREEDVIWMNKQDYAYDEEKILEAMLTILREKEILK